MKEITKLVPKAQAQAGFTPPEGYSLKKAEQLPNGDLMVTWVLLEGTLPSKGVLLG